MAYVRLDCDRAEFLAIVAICKRHETIAKRHGINVPARMTRIMDLSACHLNGCPLMLTELLAAEETDFVRDVAGITRFINRDTGQLDGGFTPTHADGRVLFASLKAIDDARRTT